jgi:hypothetical protein
MEKVAAQLWYKIERSEFFMKVKRIVIEYGPVSEPWGVRRFFVRDPLGKLVNILEHEGREVAGR